MNQLFISAESMLRWEEPDRERSWSPDYGKFSVAVGIALRVIELRNIIPRPSALLLIVWMSFQFYK